MKKSSVKSFKPSNRQIQILLQDSPHTCARILGISREPSSESPTSHLPLEEIEKEIIEAFEGRFRAWEELTVHERHLYGYIERKDGSVAKQAPGYDKDRRIREDIADELRRAGYRL